jgi:carbon monoxide dehydrogenase subunit G
MLNAQEVAPCVPGAELTETVDDTHYRGTVKFKLGAVQMTYRGELEMQADETARRIVLHARGMETRGSGGASGTFTTVLTSGEGGGTSVDIHSHVDVTGRVAQFGRSIMQDVANRLIRDFAACLETKLQTADAAATPRTGEAVGSVTSGHEGLLHEGAAPTASPPPAPRTAPNELRLQSLILTIVRSRTAALLRDIAERIDPK